MNKIFYLAYTCQGNLGDTLINKYQIDEYAQYGIVYVDCYGMPDEFSSAIFSDRNPNIKDFVKEYNIHYRGKDMIKTLRILNRDGFTHFCGSPGPRSELKLPISRLLFRLAGNIIPRLVLKSQIKWYSLGVDLQLEQTGILRMLNKWYFNVFDVLGIRTLPNLNRLKPILKNVEYIPDMAFLYPNFDEKSVCESHNRVAISFRSVDNPQELIMILKDIITSLNSFNTTVDIVYQVEEDYNFCSKLYEQLGSLGVGFKESLVSLPNLSLYSKYDMVISNRLHVLLLGAMNGAIPFAIISRDIKENKVYELFKTVFDNTLVSYSDQYDLNILMPIFQERSNYKKKVRACVSSQNKLCKEIIYELFKI